MSTYIIAEIGQNHNGSIEMAKRLIDAAAMPIYDHFYGRELPGVDAVKFTVRDLSAELDNESWKKPYKSPHSFGRTYGEHRKFLEFDDYQIQQLERYAHGKGLDFVLTICNVGRLSILDKVHVDKIKIASRDINNIPLLESIPSQYEVILSTGMASDRQIHEALDALEHRERKVSILHCVSAYPTAYEWVNLNRLGALGIMYNKPVGLSDHTIGIMLPVAAVSRGAKIIEKHFTLSRTLKGSDHFCSLEPEGMWRMVRDIRNLELAMKDVREEPETVSAARSKLGRSLAWAKPKMSGESIERSDFHMISPGGGLEWVDVDQYVGKLVARDVARNKLVRDEDIGNG